MTTKTTKPNDGGPFRKQRPEVLVISLRAWMAGMALNGLLSDTQFIEGADEAARVALRYADALISELEK